PTRRGLLWVEEGECGRLHSPRPEAGNRPGGRLDRGEHPEADTPAQAGAVDPGPVLPTLRVPGHAGRQGPGPRGDGPPGVAGVVKVLAGGNPRGHYPDLLGTPGRRIGWVPGEGRIRLQGHGTAGSGPAGGRDSKEATPPLSRRRGGRPRRLQP